MKKIETIFIISVFPALLLFCTGWGQSWQELKETAGTIHSIQADFIQAKHLKILKTPLISKGHLFFQSPGSLRWEYESPVESVLVMHGGKTTHYLKKENGYEKSPGSGQEFMQIGLQQITRLLAGEFEDTPFFSAELVPGEKLILTAKEPSIAKFVSKIELSFSEIPGIMKSVRIYESEDSYTQFSFENTTFNKPLDASLFTEARR